jgi:hypothetical protein
VRRRPISVRDCRAKRAGAERSAAEHGDVISRSVEEVGDVAEELTDLVDEWDVLEEVE